MKRKLKKLLGQAIFLSCFYMAGGMFFYWGLMQATIYR